MVAAKENRSPRFVAQYLFGGILAGIDRGDRPRIGRPYYVLALGSDGMATRPPERVSAVDRNAVARCGAKAASAGGPRVSRSAVSQRIDSAAYLYLVVMRHSAVIGI